MYQNKLIFLALVLGLSTSLGIASEALAGGKNGMKSGGQNQDSQINTKKHYGSNINTQKSGKASKSQQQKLSRNKIRHQIKDDEIYGHEMMSAEERNSYRKQLDAAQNDQEWAQLRAEHQLEIQNRAASQGYQIDPPVYGQQMMTINERKRYQDRLERASSEAQRNMIREEHQILIQERARELGLNPLPLSN